MQPVLQPGCMASEEVMRQKHHIAACYQHRGEPTCDELCNRTSICSNGRCGMQLALFPLKRIDAEAVLVLKQCENFGPCVFIFFSE